MYIGKQNGKVKYYTDTILDKDIYMLDEDMIEVEDEYVLSDDCTEFVIKDEAWEEAQKVKERNRLDALTLTPADVERALYKSKGMDFEDLKALIAEKIPTIDLKGLAIEFRAKDFYRGATANGIRLFDVVGQLLDYSTDDMDYLFQNKELPENEN